MVSEPIPFDGRSDYVGFINRGIPAGGVFAGAEAPKTAAAGRDVRRRRGRAARPVLPRGLRHVRDGHRAAAGRDDERVRPTPRRRTWRSRSSRRTASTATHCARWSSSRARWCTPSGTSRASRTPSRRRQPPRRPRTAKRSHQVQVPGPQARWHALSGSNGSPPPGVRAGAAHPTPGRPPWPGWLLGGHPRRFGSFRVGIAWCGNPSVPIASCPGCSEPAATPVPSSSS